MGARPLAPGEQHDPTVQPDTPGSHDQYSRKQTLQHQPWSVTVYYNILVCVGIKIKSCNQKTKDSLLGFCGWSQYAIFYIFRFAPHQTIFFIISTIWNNLLIGIKTCDKGVHFGARVMELLLWEGGDRWLFGVGGGALDMREYGRESKFFN